MFPSDFPDIDQIPIDQMQGHLLHNVILFGRILRELGVDINPGRVMEVTRALEHIEMWRKTDFYHTLRGLLITRRDDLAKFDEAFDLFWQKPGEEGIDINLMEMLTQPEEMESKQTIVLPPPPAPQEEDEPENDEDDDDDEGELTDFIELTQTYSDQEMLGQKDFADMTPAEIQAIKRLISQLVWQLGERQTRRLRPGRNGVLDFRNSLRRNFRYGGELLEWSYRKPKIKPRPLVIIADISGSMERYTRLLIHFLYSISIGLEQEVEVFTFSTRLTRITRQLRHKDVDRAIDDVLLAVEDWSGGTRIGEALKSFNFDWSRRVLRGGAIVLLISDGWDRGDPVLLGREMARLQRLCHRFVWLNPLLGSDEYEPLTRGMKAALPHIDDFMPVHNLASLEELAAHLQVLDQRKGGGRRKRVKTRGAAFIGR